MTPTGRALSLSMERPFTPLLHFAQFINSLKTHNILKLINKGNGGKTLVIIT